MTPVPLQLGQAPSELALISARLTPLAFANALRIGSSGPVYVAGLLRREPRIAPGSTDTPSRPGTEPWISEAQSSAHCSLHERGDLFLFGGGQLLKRKGGRPHVAVVEVRRGVEAERRVPLLELRRRREEADDLAVLRIRRHAVPGPRRERRRAGRDDLVQPLGHVFVRLRHLRDLREHVAFALRAVPVRARLRLELAGALLHRSAFLVREPLGRL